jgi:hypothetical protein
MTPTKEDQELLNEMREQEQINRLHNIQKMDEAGVPRPARKGFFRATAYNAHRICKIIEYPRENKASRWGVFVEMYEGSYTRYVYLVGPRGRCDKVT